MKSIMRMAAIVCIVAASFAVSAQAAGMARSGFLERIEVIKNTGASSTETTKIYWSGNRMRIEQYTVNGLSVQIKNGRTLYIYDPAEKVAMKTVMPENNDKPAQEVLQRMLTVPVKGGKKVGAAKVAGINCDVYGASMPGASKRHSLKVYASTDARLPVTLKLEMTAGSISQSTEVRSVKLGYNVPGRMFLLPKGTKVTEQAFKSPQMPKGHPRVGGK